MGEGKGGEGPQQGAGQSDGDGYKGGGKKKPKQQPRNKNKSKKKEEKNKPMGCLGVRGEQPLCCRRLLGGHLLPVRPRGRSIPPLPPAACRFFLNFILFSE